MSATPTPIAEVATGRRSWSVPAALRTRRGVLGIIVLAFVLAVAFVGPFVAPHPIDVPVGPPGSGPIPGAPLGTDFLGRDVLSRVLHGGVSVLTVAAVSVLLTYALALSIGMFAALTRRRWLDTLLMATVEVLIVLPPLLLLLVLISGVGTSTAVMVIGVALVLFPGAARIIRAATLEVGTTGYIESAISRGERMPALMRREVLPNITPMVLADGGVRFLGAIFLVASLNFLGVGSQPPSADWGLMISENRQILQTNPLALLAPATMLALLTISVNLLADSYAHTLGRSGAGR
ncbi:MAG: ABC transporter permease [Actinobacteria bacterium]|nr:ABC transporter permease [Actinomycetota bacterium]